MIHAQGLLECTLHIKGRHLGLRISGEIRSFGSGNDALTDLSGLALAFPQYQMVLWAFALLFDFEVVGFVCPDNLSFWRTLCESCKWSEAAQPVFVHLHLHHILHMQQNRLTKLALLLSSCACASCKVLLVWSLLFRPFRLAGWTEPLCLFWEAWTSTSTPQWSGR